MEQPHRRIYVDQETLNSIPEEERKIWDALSDTTRTKITSCHFNKGKECAACGMEASKMEAKEHDIIFDGDLEDKDTSGLEARAHKTDQFTPLYSDATRQMCKEEGVDFDQILQAWQSNTRLQAGMHQVNSLGSDSNSDSDDEEEALGIKVNIHSQGCDPREGVADFFGH